MLVEDEPLISMDLKFSLKQAGHAAVTLPDADKAIDALDAQFFDLIVTDIDMPGSMDGLRLAAAVRDRWPPVEIVVMSGKHRPSDADMPSQARFISKPFRAAELLEAIGSW